MKKTEFNKDDFKEFNDIKSVMKQLFDITCSVCGIDEIGYVASNSPEPIGTIAQKIIEEDPEISDDTLDQLLEEPIAAWQEVDDYNASIGMPTFACDNCYQQLLDGEIAISDIQE